jgi:hypothetical protein
MPRDTWPDPPPGPYGTIMESGRSGKPPGLSMLAASVLCLSAWAGRLMAIVATSPRTGTLHFIPDFIKVPPVCNFVPKNLRRLATFRWRQVSNTGRFMATVILDFAVHIHKLSINYKKRDVMSHLMLKHRRCQLLYVGSSFSNPSEIS